MDSINDRKVEDDVEEEENEDSYEHNQAAHGTGEDEDDDDDDELTDANTQEITDFIQKEAATDAAAA